MATGQSIKWIKEKPSTATFAVDGEGNMIRRGDQVLLPNDDPYGGPYEVLEIKPNSIISVEGITLGCQKRIADVASGDVVSTNLCRVSLPILQGPI